MEMTQQHKRGLLRLIALAMALCMLSSAFLERAAAAAPSPADIRGVWSEKTLLEWMTKGWLTGYPDGTVKPKREVTRAEFFSLVNKSLGYADEAGTAFSDVKPGTWKAKQVAIAVQAGYAAGYPDGTAQPDRGVTRQEVSIMVAKAFGLQPNPEETSVFTDGAVLSNAGKGSVGALVAKGVLKGYPDGSFRPNKVITREEAVVILDGALKKLERGSDKDRTFSAAGTYGPASGTETVAGNAVVAANGVTLRNMEIQGDLLLAASIGEGEARLDNVKVKGAVTVNGGGSNSIYLQDSELNTLIVDKKNGAVRIVAAGITLVKRVDLRSGAKLESDADEGKGFAAVHLTKELPSASKVILSGEFAETNVASSNVEIELIEGTIRKFNVLSGASGTTLTLEEEARIVDLTLEDEAKVQGQGIVDRAVVGEGGKKSTFERVPGKLEGEGAPAPSPGTGGGGGGGGNQDTTPPAAPVVEGVRDQGIYAGPVTPNWSDTSGTTSTATLIKDGSDKVSYTRNTEIAEDGSYILSVTARKNSNGARAVTTIRFTIDSANAVPAWIEGVEEGVTYPRAIVSWTDAPGMNSTATLAKDGGAASAFENFNEITEEGDYVLTVTTRNVLSYRAVEQQIRFTINHGAPNPVQILIDGDMRPSGEAYYNAKLYWTDWEGTTSTAMLKKDDDQPIPYEMNGLIDQDGDYVLTVTSTKLSSGLTATATRTFKVVTHVRTPNVTGFANNGIYLVPVTMSWELSPGEIMISNSLENVEKGEVADNIPNPATLTEDGTYQFNLLVGKDGEEIPFGYRFIMTGIRGLNDGETYQSVTPTWADPIGFGGGSGSVAVLSKNGEPARPYTKGTTIDEEGEYELTVTWHTGNDHSATQSVQFVIDSELPEPVEVTGVENGGTYVSAAATWMDAPGMTSTATLAKNGGQAEPYAKGTEIAEDGGYVLELTTRKDSNGREVQQAISFTIDSVPPEPADITITGGSRNMSGERVHYTASLNWTDLEGTTSTAVLHKDGAEPIPYTQNTLVDQDGDYELIVTTTKLSNELTSTAAKPFKVDGGPQPPVVEGFPDGGYEAILFGPTELFWMNSGGSEVEWVSLVNKNTNERDDSLSNPKPLDQAGEYEFGVGTRKGSEIGQYAYQFIIAGISGVEDNGAYYDSVTPDWFEPEVFGEVEATLKKGSASAEPYTKGTPITAPDNYVLTVTWSMGNNKDIRASKSVSFRVVNSLRINILGGARAINGVYHHYSAMVDWTEPPGKTSTATLLKIGDAAPIPWPQRGVVQHDGDYEVTVTWTDTSTGETSTNSTTFKVNSGPASPIVSGIKTNEVYFKPVTFTWTPFEKTTIESFNLTRRNTGEEIATVPSVPLVISEDGEYEFKVKVRRDHETAEYTYPFVLGGIKGVGSYQQYTSVTPDWFTQSVFSNGNPMTLRKDGQYITTYKRGDTITETGSYILEVTWRINGQTRGQTVRFDVNPEFPEPIEVTGIENGGTYESAAATWTDRDDATASAWLRDSDNNKPLYTKGEVITKEGSYTLEVYTYSRTEPRYTVVRFISFMIVSGPPVPVAVTGVVHGGSYPSASPTWDDAAGLTITAALSKDGGAPESYEKGTPITEPGSYVLTVTAAKENGQTAVTEISFTVLGEAPEAPTIDLNGEPNGSNYYSVSPNWTDAEGTTSTATITRTWDEEAPVTSPYERGTRIEEQGEYVLTVTTTRTSNGLTVTTTVYFTVTDQVP